MLADVGIAQVYLACGGTDLRKSIDGLALLVSEVFDLDPFSPCSLFVFCNKKRDKLKILKWDHNGFWLYYRRLERGRFNWPKDGNCNAIQINHRQLRWLLDGLQLVQNQAHSEVLAHKII